MLWQFFWLVQKGTHFQRWNNSTWAFIFSYKLIHSIHSLYSKIDPFAIYSKDEATCSVTESTKVKGNHFTSDTTPCAIAGSSKQLVPMPFPLSAAI